MNLIRVFEGCLNDVKEGQPNTNGERMLFAQFENATLSVPKDSVFEGLFKSGQSVRFIGEQRHDHVTPIAIPGIALKTAALCRLAKIFTILRRDESVVIEEPIKGTFETKIIFKIVHQIGQNAPDLTRSVSLKSLCGKAFETFPDILEWDFDQAALITEEWSSDIYSHVDLDYENPEPWLAMLMSLDQVGMVRVTSEPRGDERASYQVTMINDGKAISFHVTDETEKDGFRNIMMNGLARSEILEKRVFDLRRTMHSDIMAGISALNKAAI